VVAYAHWIKSSVWKVFKSRLEARRKVADHLAAVELATKVRCLSLLKKNACVEMTGRLYIKQKKRRYKQNIFRDWRFEVNARSDI
jgi:hypothetical protein